MLDNNNCYQGGVDLKVYAEDNDSGTGSDHDLVDKFQFPISSSPRPNGRPALWISQMANGQRPMYKTRYHNENAHTQIEVKTGVQVRSFCVYIKLQAPLNGPAGFSYLSTKNVYQFSIYSF